LNPGGIANRNIRGLDKNLSPFWCLKKMDAAVSQFGLMFFNERFLAIRMMVEADLRGWLPVMDVVLLEEQIQRILEEAEGDLNPYINSDGDVVFDSSAHIVTGTKP
jgi:hypothetical protein